MARDSAAAVSMPGEAALPHSPGLPDSAHTRSSRLPRRIDPGKSASSSIRTRPTRSLPAYERIPPEHQDLFGVRTDTPYTPAERQYSAAVQQTVQELLEGKRQQIVLLRRWPGDGERISVMPAPRGIDRDRLRLAMVERILISTLSFLRHVSPGGPVFQRETRDQLIETQQFSTRYPHIIIERVDAFDRKTREPLFTEWCVRRVQNQRAETCFNRWLDAANLALNIFKAVRRQG
jgi:hypothetical protein